MKDVWGDWRCFWYGHGIGFFGSIAAPGFGVLGSRGLTVLKLIMICCNELRILIIAPKLSDSSSIFIKGLSLRASVIVNDQSNISTIR